MPKPIFKWCGLLALAGVWGVAQAGVTTDARACADLIVL
jgi:hypothetical protein